MLTCTLVELQDAKVVDNACLALSRIAEAFAHRPASLNMLCEFGLISNAVQLVSMFALVLKVSSMKNSSAYVYQCPQQTQGVHSVDALHQGLHAC